MLHLRNRLAYLILQCGKSELRRMEGEQAVRRLLDSTLLEEDDDVAAVEKPR